jgi:hypothetical protein
VRSEKTAWSPARSETGWAAVLNGDGLLGDIGVNRTHPPRMLDRQPQLGLEHPLKYRPGELPAVEEDTRAAPRPFFVLTI